MRRNVVLRWLQLALVAAVIGSPGAQAESTWYAPQNAFAEGFPSTALQPSELQLSPRGAYLRVLPKRVIAEGETQWVHVPLSTPSGKLTGVTVCYRVFTERYRSTYITQVRVSKMSVASSPIIVDSTTDLVSTSASCHTIRVTDRPVAFMDGAPIVSLRMVFGSEDDAIHLGGIELVLDEPILPGPSLRRGDLGP